MKTRTRLLVAAVLGGSCTIAPAALVLSESFDYALNAGDAITGAGAGGWSQLSASAQNPTGPLVFAAGLGTYSNGSYTHFTSAGGAARDNGAVLGIQRTLSSSLVLNNGSEVWFSFLVNGDGGQGRFSLGTPYSSSFGVNFNPAAGGGGGNDSITGTINSGISNVTGLEFGSTTSLIVGRLQYSTSGNDIVSIWLNPSTTVFDDTTRTAVFSSGNLSDVDGFSVSQVNLHGFNTFTGSFDEIRVGTSLVDVTTVPEPGAWVLGGSLGLLGLLRRRR